MFFKVNIFPAQTTNFSPTKPHGKCQNDRKKERRSAGSGEKTLKFYFCGNMNFVLCFFGHICFQTKLIVIHVQVNGKQNMSIKAELWSIHTIIQKIFTMTNMQAKVV